MAHKKVATHYHKQQGLRVRESNGWLHNLTKALKKFSSRLATILGRAFYHTSTQNLKQRFLIRRLNNYGDFYWLVH